MEIDEWVPLLINCLKPVSGGIDFVCGEGEGEVDALFCLYFYSKHISNCLFSFHFLLYFLIQIQLIFSSGRKKMVFFGFSLLIVKRIHGTKKKWPYLNHAALKPWFQIGEMVPMDSSAWCLVHGWRVCTNPRAQGISSGGGKSECSSSSKASLSCCLAASRGLFMSFLCL